MHDEPQELYLYGCGGHAKSVIGVLEAQGRYVVAGILDDDPSRRGTQVLGYDVVGDMTALPALTDGDVSCAFVTIGDNKARGEAAARLADAGLTLATIVHPSSFVMREVALGIGVFLHAHTAIGAECVIGDHALIGHGVGLGHESVVGRCAHLAAGVVVGGNAHIGDYSLIGMGAVLMPGVRVGRHVTVASNSVVSKDLPDHTVAAGMPARQVRTTR